MNRQEQAPALHRNRIAFCRYIVGASIARHRILSSPYGRPSVVPLSIHKKAAVHVKQCHLDKRLDNEREKYQPFRNRRLVFFVTKSRIKGLTKGEKNAAKPFETRNSKEAATHGQISNSVERKSQQADWWNGEMRIPIQQKRRKRLYTKKKNTVFQGDQIHCLYGRSIFEPRAVGHLASGSANTHRIGIHTAALKAFTRCSSFSVQRAQ